LDSILTPHARARMQQRGIRPEMLEALLDYGREVHVAGGRDLVFFDKRARARLAKAGLVRDVQADRLCKSYAVLSSEGIVITVGHRYRRVPRGR
jgi:DNA-binding TFAR19-related protein (PDSD5 family)